jgi:putative acetyltransferase
LLQVIRAESGEQVKIARELFEEYVAALGLDLCFQNFERELAELPGCYAPLDGRLLLALHEGEVAGCVGLRKIGVGTCEMKRLYVRPLFRRLGVGCFLASKIIEEARALDYARMRLDTLPSQMSEAIKMYRSFGFREIEPYYHNPVEDALFMELTLK